MPSCGSNTIAFGGVDNNGCDLPAKCVFVKCTVYTKPTCSVNERIAPGVEIDPYGCPLPFKCESISSEEYKYVSQFGTSGIDNGMFNYPMGMDIDSSGYLYVADTNNNRIQKFDSDGNFKMTFGSSGIEHGQFNTPWGIDIDSYGNIYVVDTGNNRVQKFDSNGEYILGWNIVPFPVSIGGKFIAPTQIVIDSLGYVYVSDMRNSRVEKFNSDGVYQSHIGSYGTYEGMFIYPRGIDIDFLGNIYVTDIGDFRIQKFNSKGDFITKFGGSGSDNGMFNYPTDIVVDRYENIYVADTNNNRIQKFAKVPANTSTSCNLSGSKIVGNIATTTEITINCVNRNNSSSASTNIEFDPAGICKIYKAGACKVGELFWVGISADPESVNSGSSTMITWEADEADSCSLFKNGNPFNTSSTATSGTVTSGKLTSETTFKVECTKENETLEADVNVTINAPEEEDEPGEGEKNELGVSIKSINASQNGSRIEGDLYVNRNVTWTVESEDKNATRKNRIWKENGNVVSNSESYNKIYTTVGTKTIMVTDVYFKDGVWATTSATISKKVKLDQGSNEEI